MKNKVVKRKFKTTRLFTLLFICLFIVSIFMGLNAFADGNVFKLVEAIISDKSDDVTGNVTSINNGNINSDITFHEVGGNVTYNIKLKNTFDDKIKILSITDNNDSDYLIYEYDKHENEEIDADGVLDFIVKISYQNEVTDLVERNKTYNVDFLISYEKNGKVEEDTLIINPKTGDNITLSIILFVISSTGLVICFMIDKKKNTKRIVYVLAIFLLVPFTVNAATITYNICLKSNFQLYDKVVVTYEVNGEERTYLNKYNSVLDLENPEVAGYRFDKWILEDGSDYDTSTVLTEDTKIVAKMTKLEATFMYGETFNQRIRNMASRAGGDILSIERTYDMPDDSNMTSDNVVSFYTSSVPIYAWFEDGTIYYYTEDIDPALNSGAARMFQYLNKVKSIDLLTIDTSKATDMSNFFYQCNQLESLDLSNFNTSNVKSMYSMFSGCNKLTMLDLSSFDTSKVTNMSSMFGSSSSSYMALKEIKGIEDFDTSNVTNMNGMFYYCGNLRSLDLSNFDTQKVTNMGSMFRGCGNLEYLNVTSFNTSNVTAMNRMFQECRNLSSIDLSSFDTSNVLDTEYMFSTCPNLKTLDISNFDLRKVINANGMLPDYVEEVTATNVKLNNKSKGIFSGKPKLRTLDITNADVSIVTDMSHMFANCQSLTSLDLSSFVTNQVTSMRYMFNTCLNLETVNLSSFDTSNVTDISYMFNNCKKLSSINLSNFDTNKVTNMSGMFYDCNSLTSLDVTNFVTNNVADMSYMFFGCEKITSLNVRNFVTNGVTNMMSMFAYCKNLPSLDVGNFVTNNVTNMANMFGGCSSLTSLDVSNFVTDNVTNMGSMFAGCSNLTSLNLSNFNTANVTNMGSMFSRSSKLTSIDFSSFNTSNVTDMSWMFYQCAGLSSIDVSNFDTSNVTNIGEMFRECSNLVTLDLSSFKTGNVTRITEMFYNDGKLTTIYVTPSYFDVSNVTESSIMFGYCYKLKGSQGTTYSITDVRYARVDDPNNGKPGYFTDIADKPINP